MRRFILTLQLENHCFNPPELSADSQIYPALPLQMELPAYHAFTPIPCWISHLPCFLLIFQVLAKKSLQKRTESFPKIRKIFLMISFITIGVLICILHQLKPFLKLLPGSSDGKESACNVGDLGSSPGSRRSPGEGNGYPLWYSCLENSMDREAWQATVLGSQRIGHD